MMARVGSTAAEIAPARRCAFEVLRRVFEQGAFADQALHGCSRELDARDRALAMHLAYGAVQRRGTLDHLIEGSPVARPRVWTPRCSRRCGSGSTSCSTWAARRTTRSWPTPSSSPRPTRRGGHGLVNAVLRRAAREGAPGCSTG